MVYMMWNRPPFAIVTKATSGINTVKDFEGRILGGAQGTPTTRLVPVFVHYAIVLALGLYVPPYLANWYREAARLIG